MLEVFCSTETDGPNNEQRRQRYSGPKAAAVPWRRSPPRSSQARGSARRKRGGQGEAGAPGWGAHHLDRISQATAMTPSLPRHQPAKRRRGDSGRSTRPVGPGQTAGNADSPHARERGSTSTRSGLRCTSRRPKEATKWEARGTSSGWTRINGNRNPARGPAGRAPAMVVGARFPDQPPRRSYQGDETADGCLKTVRLVGTRWVERRVLRSP